MNIELDTTVDTENKTEIITKIKYDAKISYIKVLDDEIEGLTGPVEIIKSFSQLEQETKKDKIYYYYNNLIIKRKFYLNDTPSLVSFNIKKKEYIKIKENGIEIINDRKIEYTKVKKPIILDDKIVIVEKIEYKINNYEDFKNVFENNKNLSLIHGAYFKLWTLYFCDKELINSLETFNIYIKNNDEIEINFLISAYKYKRILANNLLENIKEIMKT